MGRFPSHLSLRKHVTRIKWTQKQLQMKPTDKFRIGLKREKTQVMGLESN